MVHYRKTHVCRVSGSLPSAESRALGKDTFCRVPKNSTRRTAGTRQNNSLSSAGHIPLGKAALCRVLDLWHSAKPSYTRQRASRAPYTRRPLPGEGGEVHGHFCLPSADKGTLGKHLFAECPTVDTQQTLSRALHMSVPKIITSLARTFPFCHDCYCLPSA